MGLTGGVAVTVTCIFIQWSKMFHYCNVLGISLVVSGCGRGHGSGCGIGRGSGCGSRRGRQQTIQYTAEQLKSLLLFIPSPKNCSNTWNFVLWE